MTDRELLELAAKAAGYEIKGDWFDTHRGGGFMVGVHVWNPLVDDGDALRLAVRLSLSIDVCGNCADVTIRGNHHAVLAEAMMPEGEDMMRCVRRAIVRSAAEIGIGMSAEG